MSGFWGSPGHEALPPPTRTRATTVLQGRDVTVRRGSRLTLSEVEITIRAGEVLALVGPNGAGKSTLLGVLAGDVAAESGVVELDGTRLGRWSELDRARRRAVLPQEHTVGFPFTAREVVTMGRNPWSGQQRGDDQEAVIDAMAEADVGYLADRPFAQLSGGERARVALARVLAQDTAVLLLDEPTAALDIGHQESVMTLLRRRAERGQAIVVVLHDLAAAAVHADRVMLMAAGRVLADGPPEHSLRAGLLSKVYGCPIEVLEHPRTGQPIVLPVRRANGGHSAGRMPPCGVHDYIQPEYGANCASIIPTRCT